MLERLSPPPSQTIITRFCIVLAVMVTFWIWSHQLSLQALWWDEGFSIGLASLPMPVLLEEALLDVHPPLYYLLLKCWIIVVGPTPFAARSFSVLTGLLLIPLGNRFCIKANVPKARLFSCLLLATAPFILHHVREVRMYSLGMLLTLLSTNQYIDLLGQRHRRTVHWLAYGVSIALGMLTHYFFFIVPLTHALDVIRALLKRETEPKGWLKAGVTTVLLLLPWLFLARDQLNAVGAARTQVDALRSGLGIGLSGTVRLLPGSATMNPSSIVLTVLGLLMLGTGILALGQYSVRSLRPILSIIVISPLVLSLVSLQEGEDVTRIVRLAFAAAPIAWCLIAIGLAYLPIPSSGGRLLVLVVILGLMSHANRVEYAPRGDASRDYRPLVANLTSLSETDDAILTTYLWQDGYLISYLPDQDLALYRNHYTREEVPLFLDSILANHRRVWIFHHGADVFDLGDPLHVWLHEQTALAFQVRQGLTQQALFVDNRHAETPIGREALFDNAIQLNYRVVNQTVKPPATVSVDLIWSAHQMLHESYKVFIHMRHSDSPMIVAQNDGFPVGGVRLSTEWIVGEDVIDRRAVLIPASVPNGEYNLYVGLYDATTGHRVAVHSQSAYLEPDSVCIGSLNIDNQ